MFLIFNSFKKSISFQIILPGRKVYRIWKPRLISQFSIFGKHDSLYTPSVITVAVFLGNAPQDASMPQN